MAFQLFFMPLQRFISYNQPRLQCFVRHNQPRYIPTGVPQGNNKWHCSCLASNQISQDERHSANYQPSVWSYNFLKSLKIKHLDESLRDRANKREENVRNMLHDENARPLNLLELIDDIERLGLGYLFEKDITRALEKIISAEGSNAEEPFKSLHATALKFRLLRQHGYEVSEDIFKSFKDQSSEFIVDLQKDVNGLLSLYEASFLSFEGENLLEDAKSFARIHLKDLKGHKDTSLIEEVNRTLELPLHHRMCMSEARWYIDAFSNKNAANRALLELAVLNFNMVQSMLQRDLKVVARWWTNIGLASELNFIRDRLMECFFWTVGMAYEPQFSNCRVHLTQVAALITTIDDIYDVYGSPDELQLFTEAVERWDVDVVKSLPHYMKICFLALYNTVNEMAYNTLKEQGINIIPILAKAWADLCKAFLLEAQWNNSKYMPTLEEYLENGWRSVSGNVALVHAYFLMSQIITPEALVHLEKYHDLLKWSSMIFRLSNDLGTSADELQRGETVNSIVICMGQSGLSERLARERVRNLVSEAWKKMNKAGGANSPFAKAFTETAFNLARIAEYTYQDGDAHGAPDTRSKNQVHTLIIEPINLI